MQTKILTWEEYHSDVKQLADLLRPVVEKYPDKSKPIVTGIPRGGLIVSVSLSHLLGLQLTPYPYNSSDARSKDIFVCDDIYGTGKTFENDLNKVFNKTPTYYYGDRFTVALYKESGKDTKPDYFLKEVSDWIVFPWETKESSKLDRAIKYNKETGVLKDD